MKKKFIASLLMIIILTITRFCVTNATTENAEINFLGDLDKENNIVTLTLQGSNITGIEGIIDYDNDILEYIEVEGQNNWKTEINKSEFKFVASTLEESSSEKKSIAIIKFKLKDGENINETDLIMAGISMTNIIIYDGENQSDKEDINVTLIITEEGINVEEDSSDEVVEDEQEEDAQENEETGDIEYEVNTEENTDTESNEDTEENTEEAETSDDEVAEVIGGNEQNNDSHNEAAATSAENTTVENASVEKEKTETEAEAEKETKDETEAEKDNLSKNRLPQTGMIVIPIVIIVVLTGISVFAYKKFKSIK